jgi:hypothetical protein
VKFSRIIREFANFAIPRIHKRAHFQLFTNGTPIASKSARKNRTAMLRIQRSSNGEVVFTLIGRIEVEDVAELQGLLSLEGLGRSIALDLEDVTLVDRDAVKFLACCEADRIRLENCPAYIREWIGREKIAKAGKKKA